MTDVKQPSSILTVLQNDRVTIHVRGDIDPDSVNQMIRKLIEIATDYAGKRIQPDLIFVINSSGGSFMAACELIDAFALYRSYFGRVATVGFGTIGNVQLFMDLTGKKWKQGLRLHEREFNYQIVTFTGPFVCSVSGLLRRRWLLLPAPAASNLPAKIR